MPSSQPSAAGRDELPVVPDAFYDGDGYEWIRHLAPDWHPVPRWGWEGWDLGSHPYSVVAHYDSIFEVVFGLATFTEGDVTVAAYVTREARDAATAELALHLWASWENGPKDAPAPGTPADRIPVVYLVARSPGPS